MSKALNTQQKSAVENMQAFTGANKKIAVTLLKEFNWDVESAANAFFDRGYVAKTKKAKLELPTTYPANTTKIEDFFTKYADLTSSEPKLTVKTMEIFVSDLGIDPNDIVLLILAWKCKCATACTFEKREFIAGFNSLGIDSMNTLRSRLENVRSLLNQEPNFKDFYLYMYNYAKDPGQKSMSLDIASYMWSLILQNRFRYLNEWLEFLEHRKSNKETNHSISKDTWNQLYDFTKYCEKDPGMNGYDGESAWPVMMDEFVSWLRSHSKI